MSQLLANALEHVPSIVGPDGVLLTEPFLSVCRQVLPVLDNLGTGLAIVKQDVSGNVERLQKFFDTDPGKLRELQAVVLDEKRRGVHTGTYSVTRGLLWLKRAMELVTEMLSRFAVDGLSPPDAVSAAYDKILRPYHGYLTFGVFKVAMQFVPSRESFLSQIGAQDEAAAVEQMKKLHEGFGAVLVKVHDFLESEGCNFADKV